MVLAPRTVRSSNLWLCPSCQSFNTRQIVTRRRLATAANPPQRKRKLPEFPARTRFAPSPTGYLHLGSLRTALYNYLLAKTTGGQFLLRIEDTDQSRTVPDALERICRDLEWAGLQWDEGPEVGGPYGPYIQSERLPLYQRHANILLEKGYAYRCFCTAENLRKSAEIRHKLGLPTHYDKTCAGKSKEESDDRASRGEEYVVRLIAPSVQPGYDDLVYGRVGRKDCRKIPRGRELLDDAILLKSDGWPTYHLANVVDDHLMDITHVLRAVEWMPSTPKHIHLYQAFGWTPPAFAHVGLLQGPDGQKLSKRQGDQDISTFRNDGTLPEALLNFVALLGWHHRDASRSTDLNEMIKVFDLSFTKGNAVVNFPKLAWITREFIKKHVQEEGDKFRAMVRNIIVMLEQQGITQTPGNRRPMEEYIGAILKSDPSAYIGQATLSPIWQQFFSWTADNPVIRETPLKHPHVVDSIHKTLLELSEEQWTSKKIAGQLEQAVASVSANGNMSDLWHDLRQIIMAGSRGIGMAATLEILGREETLNRLESFQKLS